MKYEAYFESELRYIEEKLEEALPAVSQRPSEIHEAMRYAMFPGGKRFRPILTLAACEACGGKKEDAILPALSLELIHGYSLVHDDLPCMDNDDERRGKPTCHKKFGEAIGLLAGDGLLTLAFQILSGMKPAEKAILALEEISTASGSCGMIGGQVAELTLKSDALSLPMLDYIHSHKTGRLIRASAVCGAYSANTIDVTLSAVTSYGELIGMAFQLVDDLLDQDGYLKLMQAPDVVEKVRDLIAKAKQEVRGLGPQSSKLIAIADYLLQRIPQGNHALDR